MTTLRILTIILIANLLIACNGQERTDKIVDPKKSSVNFDTQDDSKAVDIKDTFMRSEEEENSNQSPEEELTVKPQRETRLRYTNFSVIIHNFKGYETDGEFGNRNYYGQFGGGGEKKQAYLNDNESEIEDYIETLIILEDTIELSEILFDDRINTTLIQIIPKNESDKFKMSYCYLSTLNETIDYRNYSQKELKNFDYNKLISIKEKTPFLPIKDSAKYFFRALPHPADMVKVEVVNGKLIEHSNTQEQIEWEYKQLKKDLDRIKKKYNLHDTLVVIPGEYDTEITLTKDRKLFGYGYESFLFRIERFSSNNLIETKYIVIYISYGC